MVRSRTQAQVTSEAPARLSVGPAAVDVPAGGIDTPTTIELVQAAPATQPPNGQAGDVFYVASRARPLVHENVTLTLSVAAAPVGAAPDDVQVFFYTRGIYVPVPSTRDASGAFVIQNPDVTVLTTPADPLRPSAWNGVNLPTAAAPPGPEAPVGGYALGTPKPAQPPQCGAGSVHEEPNHVFQIIIEKQAPCDLVKSISTTLQESVDSYNKTFTKANGDAPFKHLTAQNRMKVYLGGYSDNGEYKFLSWNGYVLIGLEPAMKNADGLRETLFHEMFHAVQDIYSNMFSGGIAAMWWYEATAEWAGLAARGLSLEAAGNVELELYPEVLSVPIQKSRSYKDGLLSYGYSLLFHDIESRVAGHVRSTLHGWSVRSGALYSHMVEEGKVVAAYPDFVANIMRARLRTASFWSSIRLFEVDVETRLFKPSSSTLGSEEGMPERITDEERRYGVHRFGMTLEPLTTRFVLVNSPVLSEGRKVKVGVLSGGMPTNVGWVAGVGMGATPQVSVSRVSTEGTMIDGLGSTQKAVWIAVYNADSEKAQSFEVVINLLRPSLSNPLARCRAREYDAALRLYRLQKLSEGDAYINVASCAFAFGDYAAAEQLGLKGASVTSKGGRAHNYFVAEYAAEKQGKDGMGHGAAGIDAAKQSGMCAGSSKPDVCADIYRASVRSGLDELGPRLNAMFPPPPPMP